MNRENIKKVRDHIAALDAARFDMANWITAGDERELLHTCGTAACIGGWTAALVVRDQPEEKRTASQDEVNGFLGINKEEAMELFCPDGYSYREDLTQSAAVRVLDHLLETGEVDWSIIDTVSA